MSVQVNETMNGHIKNVADIFKQTLKILRNGQKDGKLH